MKQNQLGNLKKEFVNKAYVQDFLASDGSIIPDLSGYAYEHKYYLITPNRIKKLLDNKKEHIKEMKKLFSDCKINYATCRFYFKGLDVPLDEQKELLKLQKEIYNDVTVQMVKGNLNNFKELLKFAKTLEMPIATLIDLKKKEEQLISDVQYIAEERENISYTKWLYGKMSKWTRRYAIIRDAMNKIKMPRILTACNKRNGIENFKEIAVPLVAIAHYGFNASCREYREKTSKNKRGFVTHTDVFNLGTWEYTMEKPIKDYKSARLNNLKVINEAIDSISPQEIAKRPRVRGLFQKLVGLEAE